MADKFVNRCKHERTSYAGKRPNGTPIYEHCSKCSAVRMANDSHDRWHSCALCIDVRYAASIDHYPGPSVKYVTPEANAQIGA